MAQVNNVIQYPVRKYDELNRIVYIDWNGVERVINLYWGKTDRLKVKYRLWHEEVEVEAYDENGKVIMNNSKISLPRLRLDATGIKFIVDKKRVWEWKGKLDPSGF